MEKSDRECLAGHFQEFDVVGNFNIGTHASHVRLRSSTWKNPVVPLVNAWRAIFKSLMLLAGLVAVAWLLQSGEWRGGFNEEWIDARVRDAGLPGLLWFLLVGALLTALAVPRQLIAFLGGYAFGSLLGALAGASAALLGCILAFGYARFLGHASLRNWIMRRGGRVSALLVTQPFVTTLLLRLLPIGSNFLLNLAAGFSAIRALPFFAGSFVGYLPQSLVFALAGSGVRVDPALNLTLAFVLFVLSGLLGLWLYRRMPPNGLETPVRRNV